MKNLLTLLLWTTTCLTLFSQETRAIHFSWGVEVFPENFGNAKKISQVVAGELVQGKYVRYLQFAKTLHTAQRKALASLDIDVLGYVYPATYLLMLPETLELEQLERFSPTSIMALKPEWKMARSLREPPYGAWAVHGDHIDVNIQVYPNISIPVASDLCREHRMTVLQEGVQNGVLQVRIPGEQLSGIAALPFIRYMELIPPPGKPDDTKARTLQRANVIDSDHAMGRKFNGAGVSTLVRDDGPVGPHIDFQGRLTNLDELPSSFDVEHADWVAGCVGGAGNVNPAAKGMASGALLYNLNYEATFQDETMSVVQANGITIVNTSYTDGCNLGYTLNAQTVDQQLQQNPTLTHIFSAGNSNGNDCDYGAGGQWGNITGGHKMAKNALTVGNIQADETIQVQSSRGPATDGRIKPDISAFGTSTNMTQPDNTYSLQTGTSFSAPYVAGILAQLTQAYKTFHNGDLPAAALLRASILNTARDLGNAGPDFKFGWGSVNAWRALQLLELQHHLSAEVDQGAETGQTINIPNGTKQARLMMVWSDPPANQNAARTLLNDLDLTVVSPDGATVYLPWKIDPTPNPIILNTPAGKGRDSLNNVEQVVIDNPVAGNYTVKVRGADVPFGPQEYHLVWDFMFDDVKITYPAGGEGFAPGEVERIHWDAFGATTDFTLQYSTDGGNTFSPVATVTAGKRWYDWTVPNTVSGQVSLMLTRGSASDTTELPFNIAPVPQNIQIERVCLDSMTVTWNNIHDSLSYEVYVLGAQYMEIIGATDTNRLTFPISNAGASHWVSVRTTDDSGFYSRRAIAVNWPGELKNCPQPDDLGVRQWLSPVGDAIILCSAVSRPVSVRLQNEGLNLVSGALINYQVDQLPVITETIPDLLSGATTDFTFQTPISFTSNGYIHLKVWSDYLADKVNFNDTLSLVLPVVTQAVSGAFEESFESSYQAPLGWFVVNPNDNTTWELTNEFPNLVGADGNPTRAYYLNHYQYPQLEEQDNLYMIPVDLSSLSHPVLTFDLSHRQYDDTDMDGLRVELFPGCNLAADLIVVFEQFDPELATVEPGTVFFTPANAGDWERQYVDLSAFAGQSAVIRFVSINAYGNNTFLDNIGLIDFAPPVAEIINPADTICRQQSTTFTASQLVPNTQYAWTFGSPASPSSATGPGPHTVLYPAQGVKTIRLIATNTSGADTAYHELVVLPLPAANFSQTVNNLTVTFNNTSTNAISYLWDFGDGITSPLPSPEHTYSTPGTYTVTLAAANQCQTVVKTVALALTSQVNNLSDHLNIQILPNPTEGDFVVQMQGTKTAKLRFNLFDAQGRLIKTLDSAVKPGVTSVLFEGLQLPKGVYQLHLNSVLGQAIYSIVVQ